MVRKRVNFNGLTSFLAVMETGSFTGAARALGLSKSVVSKQVADLERELGITLLVRSARCSTPTTVGALFHRQSLLGMDALDLAVLGARGQAMTPQGELRVVSNPGARPRGRASCYSGVLEMLSRLHGQPASG